MELMVQFCLRSQYMHWLLAVHWVDWVHIGPYYSNTWLHEADACNQCSTQTAHIEFGNHHHFCIQWLHKGNSTFIRRREMAGEEINTYHQPQTSCHLPQTICQLTTYPKTLSSLPPIPNQICEWLHLIELNMITLLLGALCTWFGHFLKFS